MKHFGDKEHPLHCSQLAALIACPLQACLKMIDGRDESGAAADTGSAVHLAAQAFHTNAGGDVRLSIGVMRAGIKKFPQADLDAAEQQFQRYAADPRNTGAKVIGCEMPLSFTLPPAESDPTKAEIYIVGTADQIREENGQISVWDIKTGKRLEGRDMLDYHAVQLAAYQYGAGLALARPVRRAGVIRTQDYMKRTPGPVFWEAPWSASDVLRILDGVRHVVAAIRAGCCYAGPGGECKWCPQMGVANCLSRLVEVNG